jgi:cytoskeletal protein CcmA (bactofilin family)
MWSVFCCAMVLMVGMLVCPNVALAETTDTAGNTYSEDDVASAQGLQLNNDLFWGGSTFDLTKSQVDGDTFLAGQKVTINGSSVLGSCFTAGQTINVKDAAFGGSIRAAGETISMSNTYVTNNVTAAGQTITFDKTSSTRGFTAAGQTIELDGTCACADLSGEDVVVHGIVNGDASINAKSITIAKDAVIDGTLNASSSVEPTIESGAHVGSVQFTQTEEKSDADETADEVSNVVSTLFGFSLVHMILALLMCVVCALLLYWLGKPTITGSASMLRTCPAALLISGFVTILVVPIAFIVLLVTVIGIRCAFALLFVCLAIGFVMVPFTGAALGVLIFKKMKPLLASVLGAGIFGALGVLPFAGMLVSLFAAMFGCGYVIQWLWINRIQKKPANVAGLPIDGNASVAPAGMNGAAPAGVDASAVPPVPVGVQAAPIKSDASATTAPSSAMPSVPTGVSSVPSKGDKA